MWGKERSLLSPLALRQLSHQGQNPGAMLTPKPRKYTTPFSKVYVIFTYECLYRELVKAKIIQHPNLQEFSWRYDHFVFKYFKASSVKNHA